MWFQRTTVTIFMSVHQFHGHDFIHKCDQRNQRCHTIHYTLVAIEGLLSVVRSRARWGKPRSSKPTTEHYLSNFVLIKICGDITLQSPIRTHPVCCMFAELHLPVLTGNSIILQYCDWSAYHGIPLYWAISQQLLVHKPSTYTEGDHSLEADWLRTVWVLHHTTQKVVLY